MRKKHELTERLNRIELNVQRGLDADSEERAKQLEDSEVVDALGNDARHELALIAATLQRMENEEYGVCGTCGGGIDDRRLKAYPYASECIDCARRAETK